jgi:hypothetical protein
MDIQNIGAVQFREADTGSSLGRISLCPHKGCNFCCAEFNSGNYIVLYPGELANAIASGSSLSHLTIIDENYHGGARAICKASEPKNCDGGYKPLDCACYPLFPRVLQSDITVMHLIKGTKCPLVPTEIIEHANWVRDVWNRLISERPAVLAWLREVRLVGYESIECNSEGES